MPGKRKRCKDRIANCFARTGRQEEVLWRHCEKITVFSYCIYYICLYSDNTNKLELKFCLGEISIIHRVELFFYFCPVLIVWLGDRASHRSEIESPDVFQQSFVHSIVEAFRENRVKHFVLHSLTFIRVRKVSTAYGRDH
jgi:hypothetical protein